MTPRISLIAALSQNRMIGKDQKLLWHIPEDLKRFKKITKNHPIIMGRKTYESIGRPLPDRTNIIVTRYTNYVVPGCQVYHSLDEAIKAAKEIEEERIVPEVFIIGGADIFEQTLKIADRLYLTVVEGNYEGDAFFPDYSQFKKIISEEKGESGKYKLTFLTLEK